MIAILTRVTFALFLVISLCAAKSTSGVDFDDAALPRLQVGVTPFYDAVALLRAEPIASTVGASGNIAYTWRYIEAKTSVWTLRSKLRIKQVVLVFDPGGIFVRIYSMDGITLNPADTKRLISDPARNAHQ